jgi:hypothetical protein
VMGNERGRKLRTGLDASQEAGRQFSAYPD